MCTQETGSRSKLFKIGELAKRTGLTVRTLHHYDAIGLLQPSARTDAGYRLYNRTDLARLHHIQAFASDNPATQQKVRQALINEPGLTDDGFVTPAMREFMRTAMASLRP